MGSFSKLTKKDSSAGGKAKKGSQRKQVVNKSEDKDGLILYDSILEIFQYNSIKDFKDNRAQFFKILSGSIQTGFSDDLTKNLKKYADRYAEDTKRLLSFYKNCREQQSDHIFNQIVPKRTELVDVAEKTKLDYGEIRKIAIESLRTMLKCYNLTILRNDPQALETTREGISALIDATATGIHMETVLNDVNKKIEVLDSEYAKMIADYNQNIIEAAKELSPPKRTGKTRCGSNLDG